MKARRRLAAALLLALPLGACTLAQQPCPAGGIAALECTAARGSKQAQLELGRAYETGAGVPQDYARAAALYRAAARFTSGTTFIYSPPVGQSPGRVIPIRTGTDQGGLAEAKYRLGLLYAQGLGVERDPDRARELLEEAAAGGYALP